MTARKVYALDLLKQSRTLPAYQNRETLIETSPRLYELPEVFFQPTRESILRETDTSFAVRDRANRA